MILLTSLALAADITPGSHVLVKQGAAVSRPGGGWSEVPLISDVAWPAEVLSDDGDTLRVRVANDGCVDKLAAARVLDVALDVREADLHPMVAASARGMEKTGEAWYVGAGAPVLGQSGGVQVGAGAGLTITVPDTVQVGIATPMASARPTLDGPGEEGKLTPTGGAFGTFRGAPVVGTQDGVRAFRLDGRVRHAGRCVSFTFDRPGPTFTVESTYGGLGGLIGNKSKLARGATLYWQDGTPAGRLREAYTPTAVESTGALSCFRVPLTSLDRPEPPAIPLCVKPAEEPIADAGKRPTTQPGDGYVSTVSGDPIILGALDKSLIDDVILKHLSELRYCYQRELTKNPGLAGKIVVKFVVAKDGTVSSAVTKSTTMNSPAVESCINEKFMRFQFAEPKGGGIVIVSYPFTFSPG